MWSVRQGLCGRFGYRLGQGFAWLQNVLAQIGERFPQAGLLVHRKVLDSRGCKGPIRDCERLVGRILGASTRSPIELEVVRRVGYGLVVEPECF